MVDQETDAADKRLKKFLEGVIASKAGPSQRLARVPQQTMTYGEVIRALAERDQNRRYVARITPYAYVAAEMLGAKLDILGIYRSVATGEMTYHSYFVVPKEKFNRVAKRQDRGDVPTLEELTRYLCALRDKDSPAKFIYHDRFSTSSYFLPSLYFRTHHVYATRQSLSEEIIPIQVDRYPSTSSSDLVAQVASEKADLAAVWDGTKEKFRLAPPGSDKAKAYGRVLFIEIPTSLPNDFLVASGFRDERTRTAIVEGLLADPSANRPCSDLEDVRGVPSARTRPRCDAMFKVDGHDNPRRPRDDFDAWYAWDSRDAEIPDTAREALAQLRDHARQLTARVVVKVESKPGEVNPDYVEAARMAVRLSGTEFVLYDQDLHKRIDMTWTLSSTHDGALTLTSTLESTLDQAFAHADVMFDRSESTSISFTDKNDLPQRIADLARTRLRRIRYVWPYEEKYPAVLRDLDFTPDTSAMVQKITWLDPTRNNYEEDTPFYARIQNNTDFNKFRLSDDIRFPRNPDGALAFDPMSNVAYRVILSRQPRPGWIWNVLPYTFLGLLVLACVGFIADLRRQQPPPTGLQQTYQRMVEAYHRPWRGRDVEERHILWSDSESIDTFVKNIKSTGSLLDDIRSGGFDFDLGPIPIRFSLLMKVGARLLPYQHQLASELREVSGTGSAGALDRLLQFLVRRRRLSPFVGFPEATGGSRRLAAPMEWEALNDIASRHFRQLGTVHKEIDATLGPQNGVLGTVVSSHFRGVIKRATHRASASFFTQTWQVDPADAPDRLAHSEDLYSPIAFGNEPVARVLLEVKLPSGAVLRDSANKTVLNAWVFGQIEKYTVTQGVLLMQIKPMAVLRDHDPEE